MNVTFLDVEDSTNNLNGTVIRDSERLLQILDSLRTREPFICELAGANSFKLVIGVGNSGCAQYSPSDGSPPYLVALAPHKEAEKGYSEFLAGGTPTPVSKRYCMPFDSVREIATYFLGTGRAHPAFKWEEFSPAQNTEG
jgi:hypothetical protein